MITRTNWFPTFNNELIKVEYLLKITLDIPWQFDKSVEIPILALPPEKPSEHDQEEEFDFGFEFE